MVLCSSGTQRITGTAGGRAAAGASTRGRSSSVPLTEPATEDDEYEAA